MRVLGLSILLLASGGGAAATDPSWTAESDQSGAQFGFSVTAAGDVNGDGYPDVLVGAPQYDNGGKNAAGRAFVYHGSNAGLAASPAWTTGIDEAEAQFGWSVATAGDVNGDGFDDVIIGAKGHSNGESAEGGAYLYLGSAAGLGETPAWTAESDKASAIFGDAVGSAGDVNGDGYDDVIVGAELQSSAAPNAGRAYVYHGSASGLSPTPAWTVDGAAFEHFGGGVATAGDVNGDGFSDVVVGAPYAGDQALEGRAFVYHGSAAGLAASPAWTVETDQANSRLGHSVATAGDVNGDGLSDVVVGAYGFDGDQTDEGGAFVYHGSAAGLSTSPAWTAESDQQASLFGWSVATAGDVNGDGYADVVVGAPEYGNAEGRTLVYYGSATGLSPSAARTIEGPQAGANFGMSAGTATDVNGDGASDVLVGAPLHDNVEFNEGRAFIYPGTAASGGAGRVPDGSAGTPLVLGKAGFGTIALAWDVSCVATDTDYAIYEGLLSDFASHEPRFCSTGGAVTKTFAPLAGDRYYLVVPQNAAREGSYGGDSQGAERPASTQACQPQQITDCR